MKNGHLTGWLILLALLLAGSGCATSKLWKNGTLDAINEPDEDPRIRLYDVTQRKDVLVVYKEYSERHDHTRSRAFFLRQNEERFNQKRPPIFISTNHLGQFAAVPLFSLTNVPAGPLPPPPLALVATNGQAFTLYAQNGATNSYELPVYNDGRGFWWRVLLTPITVAADITIVGGVIGYIWLNGMADSGGSVTP